MNLKLLFKESFRIYKGNIKKIIGLLLMIYLPVTVLNVFADMKLNKISELNDVAKVLLDETISEDTRELYTAMYSNLAAKQYLYFLVLIVIMVLSTAFFIAIIKMAADESWGADLSIRQIDEEIISDKAPVDPLNCDHGEENKDTQYYFSEAVKVLPRYVLAILLAAVFVIGGLLLFVFPGLFAALVSLFVVYTVTLTPFKGRAAFVFSQTVIMKKPVVLGVYGIMFVTQILLSEAILGVYGLFNVGNIYLDAGISVVLGCIIQFFVTYLDIMTAVAFAHAVRKTPQLVEIVEAGKKYEAEKQAAKRAD